MTPNRIELAGLRLTPQRQLLLDLLRECGGHLDANELHRLARERDARVSLATVYRSLRLFKELGLVEERRLASEHLHYEPKGEGTHHHLICLGCGRVIEFDHPMIEEAIAEVGRRKRFAVTRIELRGEGHCARCRRPR